MNPSSPTSLGELLTIILTSATVSGIITVVLQALITARQAHRYAKELEEVKARLSTITTLQNAILIRKLSEYPALAEQVYDSRKIAQELVGDSRNQELYQKLVDRIKEIRVSFSRFRLDLERDG